MRVDEEEIGQKIVSINIWRDSSRQGRNGKQNIQQELHPVDILVSDLDLRSKDLLGYCIPHYQEICWMHILQDTDFAQLPPDIMLIYTDFASQMPLRVGLTKNSSDDGHAVNDNFICIYNHHPVKVKEKN